MALNHGDQRRFTLAVVSHWTSSEEVSRGDGPSEKDIPEAVLECSPGWRKVSSEVTEAAASEDFFQHLKILSSVISFVLFLVLFIIFVVVVLDGSSPHGPASGGAAVSLELAWRPHQEAVRRPTLRRSGALGLVPASAVSLASCS